MIVQRHNLQAGLTLIEMVIAVSVIVLLLVLTTLGLNQNKQRAESLEAKLQLVRAGVLRFQTDLPCGPATLSALTMRENAAVGLCGDSNNLNNWHGPYIDSGSTYVNAGDSDLSNIFPGASLAITQEVVGNSIYTILKVSEMSDEMSSAMVALCSDDCTPYKNITGDTDTIGIVVSKLSLNAFDQNGEFAALGVTATSPVGPGPGVLPLIMPQTPQAIMTPPSSPVNLPPSAGGVAPPTVITPSSLRTPPTLSPFSPSGVVPPPAQPGGGGGMASATISGPFTITAPCDGDVSYPLRATVNSNGTAVIKMDGWAIVGSGDSASLTYFRDANTCTAILDAAGNGTCELRGYADNGSPFLGYATVSNRVSVIGAARIPGATCGR